MIPNLCDDSGEKGSFYCSFHTVTFDIAATSFAYSSMVKLTMSFILTGIC
jgi:hypothetical protein